VLFSTGFYSLAGENYYFRVYLNDKGNSEYTIEEPERYLSQGAIQRRQKQQKEITFSDLPISRSFLDTLSSSGGEIITQSKWLSTVVMASPDSLFGKDLQYLTIVDSVKCIWKGKRTEKVESFMQSERPRLIPEDIPLASSYGYAESQIEMLNGIKLHKEGFTGKGISAAVIDAGFLNVDRMAVFDSLNLAGTRNFVSPGETVFEGDDHGTKVLSCMAANAPGIMVGTAPDATYWLLKSEDGRSEYPVEEDYWAAAVEFADSVGVDVISSSLGYFSFDEEEMNYSQDALDGKTAFISRIATIAAEKGILVVTSAGNEGGNNWEKITFPSDAHDVLTVGAVTDKKVKSSFSSTGFTADFRVKPDVVALGSGSCVINSSGDISYANGTSFATPILAGLSICLWQALPSLSNTEIIELIRKNADKHKQPDAEMGYGIPNMYKAYKKGLKYAR